MRRVSFVSVVALGAVLFLAPAAPAVAQQTTPQRVGSVLDVMGWPSGDRHLVGGVASLAANPAINDDLTARRDASGCNRRVPEISMTTAGFDSLRSAVAALPAIAGSLGEDRAKRIGGAMVSGL